jgi:hypothetical protein
MANALLSPKVYANAFLKNLKNNVVLPKLVSTEFKDEFKKVGSTVYAKRVPQFTVRDGAVAQVQDVVEGEIAVTMDKQKGIDVEFTSVEETLTVDALLKSKTLKSAAISLANQIDLDCHAETKKFYSWAGTPGQAINSYSDLTAGPQRLDEMAVEASGRIGLLHPSDAWAMMASISGLTAQTREATDALTKAKLPMLGDIDWYSTQNAGTVTCGTRSGDALVDGASQNVTYASVKDGAWTQTLAIDNVGNAKTVVAGEVFTIAGVNAINPVTKADLGYLQQFTVITGGTSVATGTADNQDLSLTISPPIITSGAFQTVTAAPADNAAIVWMGDATEANTAGNTYKYATILRPEAIALVSVKMVQPFTGESDYATDPDTGLTVRYWRSSDSTNDTHMHRFDVLYGVKNIDPRRGTRLSGAA